MNSRAYGKTIIKELNRVLEPYGFTKQSSSAFIRPINDVLLLIEVQKGKYTGSDHLEVTLNLGIVSQLLAKRLGENTTKLDSSMCHVRYRIGILMPTKLDKWWEIDSAEQAHVAADQIGKAAVRYGVPELERLDSTLKLVELWKSDQCPGITEGRRVEFLELLKPDYPELFNGPYIAQPRGK